MKKNINKYDLTANDIISFGSISILNGEIHTRVDLWSLKAFKKLNFKARDDVRYGLYLDYNLYNDKCKLRMVEVNNKIYNTYIYNLNERENKNIKNKLEKHCIKELGKSIETIKCYEFTKQDLKENDEEWQE